jgi:predicted transcriptional regulator
MAEAKHDVRPLHILIPAKLHARLKEMADANDRSMAAETRRAIEDRIREFKREPVDTGEAA